MNDLAKILGSKARRRILALYFSNPEEEYYLRELERKLNTPVAVIRRELIKMEESGLFVSKRKGKELYYSLNKNYSLYEEIKSIVFKTVGIKGSIEEVLHEVGGIEIAFIYGSYAKNQASAESDIDIFIVVDIEKFNEDMLIRELNRLEEKLGREINYIFYSESELLENIKSNDGFVINVLREKKIMVIGDKNELRRFTEARLA